MPVRRLNALLNADGDLYPAHFATCLMPSEVFCNISLAHWIRYSVKYSRGVVPTKPRNRAANVDRDMDASRAKLATLHGLSGWPWIDCSTGPMSGSSRPPRDNWRSQILSSNSIRNDANNSSSAYR